jgi:hypothetical protein
MMKRIEAKMIQLEFVSKVWNAATKEITAMPLSISRRLL